MGGRSSWVVGGHSGTHPGPGRGHGWDLVVRPYPRNLPLCLGGSYMLQCCTECSTGLPAGLLQHSIELRYELGRATHGCALFALTPRVA